MAFRDVGPLLIEAANQRAGLLMNDLNMRRAISEQRQQQQREQAIQQNQLHEQKKAERKARKRRNIALASLAAIPFTLGIGGAIGAAGSGAAALESFGTGIAPSIFSQAGLQGFLSGAGMGITPAVGVGGLLR